MREKLTRSGVLGGRCLLDLMGRVTLEGYHTSLGLGFLVIKTRELKMIAKSMPTQKSTSLHSLSFASFFSSTMAVIEMLF